MRFRPFAPILLTALAVGTACQEPTPMTTQAPPASGRTDREVITLGGGCFWCIEAVFQELEGVEKVESGYSGGAVKDPTYREVCTGTTGHAEVVQVTFDPARLPLRQLLEVFFTVHDPTTRDRQGADVGSQYRSVIFYRDEGQKRTAEEVVREVEAEKLYPRPLVTQIVPFRAFYRAEDYHQDYYAQHSDQPYCLFTISPKLAKFRSKFASLRRPSPAP